MTERSAAPAADAACPKCGRSREALGVSSHTRPRVAASRTWSPGMGLRVLDKSREFGTVQVQSVLWRTVPDSYVCFHDVCR